MVTRRERLDAETRGVGFRGYEGCRFLADPEGCPTPFVCSERGDCAPPRRVQLSRRPGSRLPEGAVRCDRATIYGNHAHRVPAGLTGVARLEAQTVAAGRFRVDLVTGRCVVPQRGSFPPFVLTVERVRGDLAGRDLACWCGLGEPCHVDVLLEVANA